MTGRAPAEAHGQISLQRMPRQAPWFANIANHGAGAATYDHSPSQRTGDVAL